MARPLSTIAELSNEADDSSSDESDDTAEISLFRRRAETLKRKAFNEHDSYKLLKSYVLSETADLQRKVLDYRLKDKAFYEELAYMLGERYEHLMDDIERDVLRIQSFFTYFMDRFIFGPDELDDDVDPYEEMEKLRQMYFNQRMERTRPRSPTEMRFLELTNVVGDRGFGQLPQLPSPIARPPGWRNNIENYMPTPRETRGPASPPRYGTSPGWRDLENNPDYQIFPQDESSGSRGQTRRRPSRRPLTDMQGQTGQRRRPLGDTQGQTGQRRRPLGDTQGQTGQRRRPLGDTQGQTGQPSRPRLPRLSAGGELIPLQPSRPGGRRPAQPRSSGSGLQHPQPSTSRMDQENQYQQPSTSRMDQENQYQQPSTSGMDQENQYPQPSTSGMDQENQYQQPSTSGMDQENQGQQTALREGYERHRRSSAPVRPRYVTRRRGPLVIYQDYAVPFQRPSMKEISLLVDKIQRLQFWLRRLKTEEDVLNDTVEEIVAIAQDESAESDEILEEAAVAIHSRRNWLGLVSHMVGEAGIRAAQAGQVLGEAGIRAAQAGQVLGETGYMISQAGQTINQAGQRIGQAGHRLGDRMGAAGQRIGQAGHRIGDRMGAAGHRMGGRIRAAGHRIGQAGHRIGGRVGAAGHRMGRAGHRIGGRVGAAGNRIGQGMGRAAGFLRNLPALRATRRVHPMPLDREELAAIEEARLRNVARERRMELESRILEGSL